jgi:hypothetical protein
MGLSLPNYLSECPVCSVRYGHFPGDPRPIARTINKERTPLSILQAWLFVGIPCLVAALTLFYGRSRIRTMLGYLVLAVGFGVMMLFDRSSAAGIGAIGALLYAAGRGGSAESELVDTSTIAVPDTVRRTARFRAE